MKEPKSALPRHSDFDDADGATVVDPHAMTAATPPGARPPPRAARPVPPPPPRARPSASTVVVDPALARTVAPRRNTNGTSEPSSPGSDISGVSGDSGSGVSNASASSNLYPSADGEAGGEFIPKEGTRIAQYELIRELGRGGMGAVFLARDIKLGRRVAIKFLQGASQELIDRFELEARATAQLNHENIVIIHEIGKYQENPFMVLEFLEGVPLGDLIKKGASLPAGRVVEIMLPVVRALVRAHEANIVHRDLKPDNIFITDSGTIKVLDFGIAKLLHQPDEPALTPAQAALEVGEVDNTELTRRGAIVGTLAYMSPEQWGMGTVDHRTDIWAVGILMYRMLAGRHPLAPLRGQQLVVTAMLDQPMPSLRDKCPGVQDELAAIVDRCLIKNKDRRIGSARELLRLLEPIQPGRYARTISADESPYAGLSAFQEGDADRFFGRSREIAAMVARLRDQPLLGVVGPSGVGKSSFVRAGVVPALKHSGEAWETVVVRPGRHPLAALAAVVAPLVSRSSKTVTDDLTQQQETLHRLYTEPGYLGTVLRSRARRHKRKIMLFVDQFEELYTLIPDIRERIAFTTCLAGVADDATAPLRVVISIRSDFLDRASEDPRFMTELTRGIFFLPPPSRDGLRDAIVQPAEMAGYHFESQQIVDDMLDNLESTQGALPLLQFTATKLWDARDIHSKLLTAQSYQSIGGIVGALASHADLVLSELSPQAQGLIRAIFLRLVTPERTRAIATVGELYELSRDANEVHRLVNHLVEARLLVVQTSDAGSSAAGPSVEIVHESLIHSWPLLRRWLDENQDDAAFLDQLRNAAKQWQAKSYPSGLLWRGEAMEEARRWNRRYKGELPQLQRAYLSAVFALADRAMRIKRYSVIAAFAVLTLILAGGTKAYMDIREANKVATLQTAAAVKAEQTARIAEQAARDQLAATKAEMLARQKAEAEARAAQQQAEKANTEVERTYEELAFANEGLTGALEKATRAKRRARRARAEAEEKEAEARAAEAAAIRAGDELEKSLERERERVKRLENQLGSPLVERLK